MDRFIPNRAAMNFEYAHYMVTEGRKVKKNPPVASPAREAYRRLLAETFDMNQTHIFTYRNKPRTPIELFPQDCSSTKPVKPLRCIRQKSVSKLEAAGIMDDYLLNLLDWGSNNVLAIALGHSVYLWDESKGCVKKLLTTSYDSGPVTSVSWDPDGRRIAVGLRNSEVQLWEYMANRHVRTFEGHSSGVVSLAWNNQILTSGGMDGQIMNNDVRIGSRVVETFRGHQRAVCGLKWSASGELLASGGNDRLLYIWDRYMASSQSPTQWRHRLEDHKAAVKALAWCPFQRNLVASGGGVADRSFKFWNAQTGVCLSSVATGSQVCALLWSRHEKELLSSHGFCANQLILWKYPSMAKIAELSGHKSRVLFMAESPDGYTVASAGADERIRFWNVFGTPRHDPKPELFAHVARVR